MAESVVAGPLTAVTGWLRCPHCESAMEPSSVGLDCEQGHHFDRARQGYISLLGPKSRTDTGDSSQMVAARVAFLADGCYSPIADAVVAAWYRVRPELSGESASAVEVGAGTGYYLAALLDSRPPADGLALDSSARAARRAAGAHQRMASVVADAWDKLPLNNAVADLVLSVFAPRQVGEICRILAAEGVFIAVTPMPGHLGELIAPFRMLTVDQGKAAKLAADFAGELTVIDERAVTFSMELEAEQIRNLIMMGPSARHLESGDFDAALADLAPLTAVTASVTVSVLSRAN